MSLHVPSKSSLQCEGLRTNVTLVWALIFTGVHAERVHIQGVLILVLLSTQRTKELIRVVVKINMLQNGAPFEQFLVAANYVTVSLFVFLPKMTFEFCKRRGGRSTAIANHGEMFVEELILFVPPLLSILVRFTWVFIRIVEFFCTRPSFSFCLRLFWWTFVVTRFVIIGVWRFYF